MIFVFWHAQNKNVASEMNACVFVCIWQPNTAPWITQLIYNLRQDVLIWHTKKFSDILLQITVFPCMFNWLQVKPDLISSIINFVYMLIHDLPNNLKLRILTKLGNEKKISKLGQKTSDQSPLQKLIFGNSGQNLHKSRYQISLI